MPQIKIISPAPTVRWFPWPLQSRQKKLWHDRGYLSLDKSRGEILFITKRSLSAQVLFNSPGWVHNHPLRMVQRPDLFLVLTSDRTSCSIILCRVSHTITLFMIQRSIKIKCIYKEYTVRTLVNQFGRSFSFHFQIACLAPCAQVIGK